MTTSATAPGHILSAYLGAVNVPTVPFCPTPAAGPILEGLPVVFDRQIDDRSLQASRFTVTNQLGQAVSPSCVTLRPADEENEDNTVLLVGDFVPDPGVTVVAVAVSGLDAEPADGGPGEPFGALVFQAVTPVTESTRLIAAALADPVSAGCPAASTQAIRATWIGGIRPLASDPAARITVRDAAGATIPLAGVVAAEQADNDNILDVCLASPAAPAAIEVAASTYTAPNTLPNEATQVAVSGQSGRAR